MKKTNKKSKFPINNNKYIFKNNIALKIFSLSFAVTILFLLVVYSVVVVKNKCSYLPTDFYKIEVDEQSPYFQTVNNIAQVSEKVVPMFLPKVYFVRQFVYAAENFYE